MHLKNQDKTKKYISLVGFPSGEQNKVISELAAFNQHAQ
jgi:hypothetical protein